MSLPSAADRPLDAPANPSLPLPALPVPADGALARLAPDVRDALLATAGVDACSADALLADADALGRHLWLLAEGSIALRPAGTGEPAGVLWLRPGDFLGLGALPHGDLAEWTAVGGPQGARLWRWAADDLAGPAFDHPSLVLVGDPRAWHPTQRPGGTAPGLPPTPSLLVRDLVRREPVTVDPGLPIREAARLMSRDKVSSLLLVRDGRLEGILTDRDLRNRVLARDLSPDEAVRTIATASPHAIDGRRPSAEALLLMARHNIHHLPVLDQGRVSGVLTGSDMLDPDRASPANLVRRIHACTAVDAIAEVTAEIPRLQQRLAAAGTAAHSVGYLVTALADATTVRLLQMAEARLGPPPVPYAWVAAGSQARCEQMARSDQDNGMILDDGFDAGAHGAYFEALSQEVTAGLDRCGYVFCPGDMMARNPTWRSTARSWTERFSGWIDTPEPKALMLTSVFFDMRFIHGAERLVEQVRGPLLARTRGHRLFLSHMVGNALHHRVPLNLFGALSTSRHAGHRDTLDLKHTGSVPIIDLARIYALAGGSAAVNTDERLAAAPASMEVSESGSRDLRDALAFITALRLRHQAAQARAGETPDNHVRLSELGQLERRQLKDAFTVVQELQSVLASRYR